MLEKKINLLRDGEKISQNIKKVCWSVYFINLNVLFIKIEQYLLW